MGTAAGVVVMRISGIPYVQGVNAYTDQDGRKYGIAIHNTSNNASAEAEASYATRRTDRVSAHLYCDHDSVIQSLDTDSKAGHAGSSTGNEHAVAVEITGFNGWSRDHWLSHVAWDKLGAALAQVVRHYGIAVRRARVDEMVANPKVRAFYSHDDMRRAWGGTDHTDPGPSFPWDRLFAAVNAALGGSGTSTGDDDMEQTEALTQGNPGYAGHQLATAWAFTWEAAARAKTNTDLLLAAAVADETRDKATLAAVQALTVATGNDPTPILDAITAARTETHDLIIGLQRQLSEVQARNARLAEALAAAGGALDAADD